MHCGLRTISIAAGLVAGIGAAVAAGPVNLSQTQKQTIQQNMTSEPGQLAPAGFQAQVGAKAPSSLSLKSLPSEVTSQIPSLKSDRYAKLKNNKIVIVDPSNRQVVAVIQQSSTTGSGMPKNENVPNSPK